MFNTFLERQFCTSLIYCSALAYDGSPVGLGKLNNPSDGWNHIDADPTVSRGRYPFSVMVFWNDIMIYILFISRGYFTGTAVSRWNVAMSRTGTSIGPGF